MGTLYECPHLFVKFMTDLPLNNYVLPKAQDLMVNYVQSLAIAKCAILDSISWGLGREAQDRTQEQIWPTGIQGDYHRSIEHRSLSHLSLATPSLHPRGDF